MSKTIDEILEQWLDDAMSTSSLGWSPIDGYKGHGDNSEAEATKDYDLHKAKAKQAVREAIERVRPPYPDRARQPEVYHQLKDKVDEWNEALDAVLRELGLDGDNSKA